MLFAELKQFPFRQIRVGFNLHHGRFGHWATATISFNASNVISDKPMDLQRPSSTRRSSALQVSISVTPES